MSRTSVGKNKECALPLTGKPGPPSGFVDVETPLGDPLEMADVILLDADATEIAGGDGTDDAGATTAFLWASTATVDVAEVTVELALLTALAMADEMNATSV